MINRFHGLVLTFAFFEVISAAVASDRVWFVSGDVRVSGSMGVIVPADYFAMAITLKTDSGSVVSALPKIYSDTFAAAKLIVTTVESVTPYGITFDDGFPIEHKSQKSGYYEVLKYIFLFPVGTADAVTPEQWGAVRTAILTLPSLKDAKISATVQTAPSLALANRTLIATRASLIKAVLSDVLAARDALGELPAFSLSGAENPLELSQFGEQRVWITIHYKLQIGSVDTQ